MKIEHKRICLNGQWNVIYDEENKGRYLEAEKKENYMKWQDVEDINVPSCLEEYKQDYEGVAYYYKSFFIPEDIEGKTVRIAFDAVNYRSELWVNGDPVGMHEGGYTGFEYDITGFLRYGEENYIVVRVITPIITKDVVIDGLAKDEAPHWRAAIAGGIWQDVYLKVTGAIYMKDVFIQPDINEGKIDVSMENINTTQRNISITLNAMVAPYKGEDDKGTDQMDVVVEPGINTYNFSYDMGSYRLWSCDDPNLYMLNLKAVVDGEVSESLSIRFGMREFTIKGTKFYLNDEKIIIKGVFYEGMYPHSLAYPRDIEVLYKTLQYSKDAGLNLIRPWRKPQPTVVYDMADEMGLLFVGALPVECMRFWPRMTPAVFKRIDNEIEEMIIRDRNHASIVMWEMFNEIHRLSLQNYKHKASLIARYNDPARIILDEAGGFAGGASIYMPYSKTPTVMNDVHCYPGAPLDDKGYELFLALTKSDEELEAMGIVNPRRPGHPVHPGLLTNISEIGYGSVPDLEDNLARYRREGNPLTPDYRITERLYYSYKCVLEESGVMPMFGSVKAFCTACQAVHANGNKHMVESCRMNDSIGGIMVHALTDGDWVVGAGLLDIFGDPKAPYYGTAHGFKDPYIAIRTNKPNGLQDESFQINLAAANDKASVSGVLSLYIKDEQGNAVTIVDSEALTIQEGIMNIGNYDVVTDNLLGACEIEAIFTVDGIMVESNNMPYYVVEKVDVTKKTISVIETEGQVKTYAEAVGIMCVSFDENQAIDVPVILCNIPGEEDTTTMEAIARFVERGGDAIILEFPDGEMVHEGRGKVRTIEGYLPFEMTFIQQPDLWTPCNHIAKDHPIFHGLPTQCLMDMPYKNVRPKRSIESANEDWIAGSIYYTWFVRGNSSLDYRGVDNARHAADLAVVKHGNGRFVLSTFRLRNTIMDDRFAQVIFNNMVEWL